MSADLVVVGLGIFSSTLFWFDPRLSAFIRGRYLDLVAATIVPATCG